MLAGWDLSDGHLDTKFVRENGGYIIPRMSYKTRVSHAMMVVSHISPTSSRLSLVYVFWLASWLASWLVG